MAGNEWVRVQGSTSNAPRVTVPVQRHFDTLPLRRGLRALGLVAWPCHVRQCHHASFATFAKHRSLWSSFQAALALPLDSKALADRLDLLTQAGQAGAAQACGLCPAGTSCDSGRCKVRRLTCRRDRALLHSLLDHRGVEVLTLLPSFCCSPPARPTVRAPPPASAMRTLTRASEASAL